MYFNTNMKKNGFSLVELLVAMAVGLVIMAAVYGAMNTAQMSSASIGRKVLTQQDARTVLYLMAMEIRMASFNPRFNSAIWSTIPAADSTCDQMGLATSIVARKGIQIADSNNILVAMNLNADAIIGPPGTNEYISYAYDAGTSTITRNVSCSGDQIILGGAGSSTMVRNSDAPVTPLFQYFDESGTDISAAVVATPDTSIRLIRRIRINIIADVETQGRSFNVTRRTYTTDVLVKNHAVSP
jgi:prepilin-type N-terminal cleavage/methylation domain-containing protein